MCICMKYVCRCNEHISLIREARVFQASICIFREYHGGGRAGAHARHAHLLFRLVSHNIASIPQYYSNALSLCLPLVGSQIMQQSTLTQRPTPHRILTYTHTHANMSLIWIIQITKYMCARAKYIAPSLYLSQRVVLVFNVYGNLALRAVGIC